MSVARGYGLNGKSIYTNVAKPILVNCQFTVNHTNSAGLGITSLKSNGYIEAVFMNTTQTPGRSAGGILNPNPIAGYAMVIFKNNFNYYLGGFSGQTAVTTSNSTTSLTTGNVYVITLVGTTTTAQWQAAGLPYGLTPTVGQSFVAIATASLSGSGTVGIPGVLAAPTVSIIGDPNQSIANLNVAQNAGARVIVQFSALGGTVGSYTPAGTVAAPVLTMNSYTPAGTNNGASPPIFAGTPATLTGTNSAPAFTGTPGSLSVALANSVTAPADSTLVTMQFLFDGSSVTIDGI